MQGVCSGTPAAGNVVFDVAGAGAAPSVLEIFDSAGRRIFEQRLPATPAIFDWNGRGTSGGQVANGIYYARLPSAIAGLPRRS